MNKKKYYMRGLGFGILITTIIMMVGNSKRMLTDANAIQRVKDLGYVISVPEKDSINIQDIKNNLSGTPSASVTPVATPKATNTMTPKPTFTPTPTPTPTKVPTPFPTPECYKDSNDVNSVKFTVYEPMTFDYIADMLFKNGIITDKEFFLKTALDKEALYSLNKGTYTITEKMTTERIIRILTGK